MLGQRLKEARIEACLSQRQLCGQEITRNMLSQIEGGKARPSMQTLTYLAQTLGKPVSWFLEEQPAPMPTDEQLQAARDSFRAQDYQQCLEQLEQLSEKTDEAGLLQVLCLMALARQAVTEQRYHYARSLLEKVATQATMYYSPFLERERLLLLYQCGPEQASQLVGQLPDNRWEILLRAESRLQAGEYEPCIRLLEAAGEPDDRHHYLKGQALLGQGEYALAAEQFLLAEEAYPTACAQALETCYRELEDYKRAYQYACKQRT